MREVVVDGVRYVPEGDSCRIGLAITTHNRPEVFRQSLEAWLKHLPEDAVVVVVDDASAEPVEVPEGVRLVRSERNLGIARAKNRCIAELMDAGCTDLFLADDDVTPLTDEWWRPYVESPEPHLMHAWGDAWGDTYFRTDELVGYQWPKGCLLYLHRRAVERVGGMDPVFGRWGLEHVNLSDRIHNAGLTTVRYGDVPGSEKLFRSMDRFDEVETSVPLEDRLVANVRAAEELRDSDAFVPYRETSEDAAGVVLSVLVPAVASRRATFTPRIMDQLFGQHERLAPDLRRRVEILVLTDAKGLVLGEKRNAMVRLARGEYVAFVDDDDRVSDDYLETLVEATRRGSDVVTFNAEVRVNGGEPKLCRYSSVYGQDRDTDDEYHRVPNHLAAVRRELALRTPFPARVKGEDSSYSAQLLPLLRSEHHLDRVLYFYDYDSETTETQGKSRVELLKQPTVDVVILSKAETPELRAMTEEAIRSCRAGAGDHSVNVVVVEQVEGVRYRDTVTLYRPDEFAYNRFANGAIRTGSARWVMVANSDLVFEDGWLDALLAANHPLVSPRNPNERRQDVSRNETGYENGKHFSGWCFMMERDLWERIGGLDEEFIFWCADDSVIEQVRSVGVAPMIVPDAVVTHLISKTVGEHGSSASDPKDGAMTWAMVHRFNEKYGQAKFTTDSRYRAWRREHGIR